LDEKVETILAENFETVPGKPLLLDIGAGRGEFALFLQNKGRAGVWNYLGFEPSSEQLQQRDVKEFGMGFIQALAEQLPLPDMTAHGVLVKEAIDHCFDPSKVFSESKRLLKPGGVLVVTVTNDKSYFKRVFPFINQAHKAHQTDHLFFFGPEDLRKLAIEAKFDRVSVETYNYLKFPRVLEKVLSLFGENINRGLLNVTDAIGKSLLPGLGGGVILKAYIKENK
jgi:ubiquinone/menaquinone biosynthesis C-methylase UbiE